MSYKAVYARHFGRYFQECDTFDEAVSFLQGGADDCQLFQICIVGDNGKVYLEGSPTIEVSDAIPEILRQLSIPFSSERGTFELH